MIEDATKLWSKSARKVLILHRPGIKFTRFWRSTAPETGGFGGPSLMPRCFSRVRYGKSVTRGVLTATPGAVPPPVLLMTLSIPPFTVRLTVTR
jgi:hypothetical protein